jgi:hypothetical protein
MAVARRRPGEGLVHHSDRGRPGTRRSPSARRAVRTVSRSPIATRAARMTTPRRSLSSPHWRRSGSGSLRTPRTSRRAVRSSSTSRSSTTAAGCTPRSATARPKRPSAITTPPSRSSPDTPPPCRPGTPLVPPEVGGVSGRRAARGYAAPLAPRGSLRCEPPPASPQRCPRSALPSSVRALSYADTVNSNRVHGTGGRSNTGGPITGSGQHPLRDRGQSDGRQRSRPV